MFDAAAGLLIEAVLNGLWQGLLLTALLWLLLRVVPCSAAMRYAAWYACLVSMLALPALHLALSVWPDTPSLPASVAPASLSVTPEPVSAAPLSNPEPAAVWNRFDLSLPSWAAVALFAGWLLIALWLGMRLLKSYLGMIRLKRNSIPLDDPDTGRWSHWFAACFTRRSFDVRRSSEVPLPMLAGLARPAILFPESLVPRLTAEEKFRICLHELAHIRRHDDWANLLQRIAEAAFFFHPAVRWIGGRLNFEREIACDDWVVAVSGSARPYAACLVRLAEYASLAPHRAPTLASVSDRRQIFRRVEMLLNRKQNAKPGWSKAVFVGVLLVCLAASVVAAKMTPVITVDDPPAPAAAPVPPVAPAPPAAPVAPAAPAVPAAPQAPAPPAAPASSAHDHARAAAEHARATAEQMRAMIEQMRPNEEEMRKLAEEIRKEVDANVKPKTDEIRKLAEQIREKVEASIKPHTSEIAELAKKLAEAHVASQPNEEQIRKLEQEMKRHETEINRVTEQEVKALEEKIRAIELTIKPSEAQIRKLEEKMREMEKQFRDKEREFQRQFESTRPDAPPKPPAAAAPTTPPPPPPQTF